MNIFGPQQDKPEGIQGILQTKNYNQFIILDDTGNKIHEFEGAKLANKCLPGDHIKWDEKCILELRDEHPLIVGTIECKTKYGFTKKHVPIYLFTPYNKSYPHFIVSCSHATNLIVLVKFDQWSDNLPRGHIEKILGTSGDFEAEKEAIIWQACPYKYPKGEYIPKRLETERKELNGFTFNIDPEGCRDIDDVLTFEKLEEGWNVTITISDVAAYVESDSIVDIFASLMGQTLYENGQPVRPMLPQQFSDECSLFPNKISYGISLQFRWANERANERGNERGNERANGRGNGRAITNIEWFESICKNNKSYTYEEFDKLDSEYKPILKEIAEHLVTSGESMDSHGWIEQMMLFYNNEAGKLLKTAKMGILRKQSKPLEPQSNILASAEYCLAEEDSNHYCLQSDHYAHVSSPIRRYADLLNQRVLKLILIQSNERYIIPLAMYDMNKRAKRAKNYERDLCFLEAIQTSRKCKAILIEIKESKIKLYIPEWKKCVSVAYKKIDDTIWSMDEQRELNLEEIEINCTFNLNARNWKEKVIINIV